MHVQFHSKLCHIICGVPRFAITFCQCSAVAAFVFSGPVVKDPNTIFLPLIDLAATVTWKYEGSGNKHLGIIVLQLPQLSVSANPFRPAEEE